MFVKFSTSHPQIGHHDLISSNDICLQLIYLLHYTININLMQLLII